MKTSGDSYMVVSGVPANASDHLEALASLALDMAETVAGLTDPQGREVPLRIGMAAGPVVAGVVGARKFFYDVWGDAVNVASRMESHRRRGSDPGAAGRLRTPARRTSRSRSAATIDVKGKGVMHTWYLTGHRPTRETPRTEASRLFVLLRQQPRVARAHPSRTRPTTMKTITRKMPSSVPRSNRNSLAIAATTRAMPPAIGSER